MADAPPGPTPIQQDLLIGPAFRTIAAPNPFSPGPSTHRIGFPVQMESNSDGSSPATVEVRGLCHWYGGQGRICAPGFLADVGSLHPTGRGVLLLTGPSGMRQDHPCSPWWGDCVSSAGPSAGCWRQALKDRAGASASAAPPVSHGFSRATTLLRCSAPSRTCRWAPNCLGRV